MKRFVRRLMPIMSIGISLAALPALGDDIDIFAKPQDGAAGKANVLIVLDNTPNWSRQSQKWPGGITQGEAEVDSIKTAMASVKDGTINLGLMEFVTEGNANTDGGYLRFAVKELSAANKTLFGNKLTTIRGDINGVHEKTNGMRAYGNLMYDVYNYLSSGDHFPAGGQYDAYADSEGYNTPFSTFKSPLSEDNSCASTNIIFIGNAPASGPFADGSNNTDKLNSVTGSTTQLYLPQPVVTPYAANTAVGVTPAPSNGVCYANVQAVQDAYGWGYSSSDNLCRLYAATRFNATTLPVKKYSTIAQAGFKDANGVTITADQLGNDCPVYDETYKLSGATVFDMEGVCGNLYTHDGSTTGVVGTYANGCAIGTAASAAYQVTGEATSWSSDLTTTTYYDNSPPPALFTSALVTTSTVTSLPVGAALACPSDAIADASGHKCTYSVASSTDAYPAATHVQQAQDANTSKCFMDSSRSSADRARCTSAVNCYLDPNTSAVTKTNANSTADPYVAATFGLDARFDTYSCTTGSGTTNCSLNCSATSSCTYTSTATLGSGSTCKIAGTGGPSGLPTIFASYYKIKKVESPLKKYKFNMTWKTGSAGNICTSGGVYNVDGRDIYTTNTASTTLPTVQDSSSKPHNADEWAKFLFQKGVKVGSGYQKVSTYTIDVYNAQQSKDQTALLLNMAKYGGGRYFQASNSQAITDALIKILNEIQSVNTTFASASLPVSATNRTQNANQVFIGMFRPDKGQKPRWFGNLKQYAVGRNTNNELDLVDQFGNPATNLKTGFISDCASSFWNVNSYNSTTGKAYWEDAWIWSDPLMLAIDPSPSSPCVSGVYSGVTVDSPYSDFPDGPFVEKGSVAAVIRRGNDPPTTTTTPTWARKRTMYKRNGTTLDSYENTSFSDPNLLAYVLGKDLKKEQNEATFRAATDTETVRPSVHGDVVHSRPLPVNYGDTYGVVAYYGSNDGALRAVDSKSGKELWAFIPPEFNESRLKRLMDNKTLIDYPTDAKPEPTSPKDYLFDGSIGVGQDAANSKVWIFPTQRRGGRMVYAFDVTTPSAPKIKWYQGCENNNTTGDTTGCTSNFDKIGQTWSTPSVAFIKGYGSGASPVVIFGGGYDTCEDEDTMSPSKCASAYGGGIYIVDADTGTLLRYFATESKRSVVADVALADVNQDNMVDYAYVVDTGGNIYRINFLNGPGTQAALSKDNWTMQKIAYTNGGGRKMLFNAGVLPYQGKYVYLAVTTGDREHPMITSYPYKTPVQNRAYVYLDPLTNFDAVTKSSYPNGADEKEEDKPKYLIQCNLDSDDCTANYSSDAGCDTEKILPGASKRGWRMNFPDTGEQGVTSALIAGGMVTFSTNRPMPNTGGTCANPLGEAKGYWVNLLNASGAIDNDFKVCGGRRSTSFAGGGLPPSPVTGIVPVDGKPTVVVIGAPPRDGGVASPVRPVTVNPPIPSVRNRKYKFTTIDK